ncbi:MAG: hypothetical protein KDC53_08405 [Saprospiraceae bacterium]|nr:hypothetical protein [Saprospiraceae bacterium]
MCNRKQVFEEACQLFIQKQGEEKDTIGIIICGSLMHGRIDKNSDVDVYIILNSNCTYRERGNVWINNVEIEYFKNPPQQVRKYFAEEKASPNTAHMLASGRLVFSKSNIARALMEEAKEIIAILPREISRAEIELAKYIVDDYFKDMEDAIENGDSIGIGLIHFKIVNYAVDLFCKVKRIRRFKDKGLGDQLRSVDPEFAAVIEKSILENWEKIVHLTPLRNYIDDLLGGRRSREWILRSNLTI